MNSLIDKATSAEFSAGQIVVHFASGLEVRFPVTKSPRLAKGSPSELSHIEISPFGLHWPDLDEDLSFSGILRGQFGPAEGLTSR
jgi:Protein of unknown function (DUF2442)